jgi:hypothetical protein
MSAAAIPEPDIELGVNIAYCHMLSVLIGDHTVVYTCDEVTIKFTVTSDTHVWASYLHYAIKQNAEIGDVVLVAELDEDGSLMSFLPTLLYDEYRIRLSTAILHLNQAVTDKRQRKALRKIYKKLG